DGVQDVLVIRPEPELPDVEVVKAAIRQGILVEVRVTIAHGSLLSCTEARLGNASEQDTDRRLARPRRPRSFVSFGKRIRLADRIGQIARGFFGKGVPARAVTGRASWFEGPRAAAGSPRAVAAPKRRALSGGWRGPRTRVRPPRGV